MSRKTLATREDFIIEQFAFMRRLNSKLERLFDIYYVDVDPGSELTPMMRQLIPQFFVDPFNPEYPGRYRIAGKSRENYLERVVYVTPYVDKKGKYLADISAWKGLLFNSSEFSLKCKAYRKSKLEPYVFMGDTERGGKYPEALMIRESDTKAKEEMVLPFLKLPDRAMDGEDMYQEALHKLIYQPFYRFLIDYLRAGVPMTPIPEKTIDEIMDEMNSDYFVVETGDTLTLTRDLMPGCRREFKYEIGAVPRHLMPDPEGPKQHYILKEKQISEEGAEWMTTYTLFSTIALQ